MWSRLVPKVAGSLGLLSLGSLAHCNNPQLVSFLDIEIAGQDSGRILIELRPDVAPKTVENFTALCTGAPGFGYKGCRFHRIIPGFMGQTGDFTVGDGTGGRSIYGTAETKYLFDDEIPGTLKHSAPFMVSMANAGKNTNGSQFFITFDKAPHLDGKHTLFGKVLTGKKVVRAIEQAGTPDGKPKVPVAIRDCGIYEPPRYRRLVVVDENASASDSLSQ